MNLSIPTPSPLTYFESGTTFVLDNLLIDIHTLMHKNNINITCKRDDLLHPIISGNKWRKLQGALNTIKTQKYKHVLSFGGGYSNHLHALSYTCKSLGIKFTAVVRGDYSGRLTPTLEDMKQWGTEFHFVSKKEYQQRNAADYCRALLALHRAQYIIPEGGSDVACLQGVAGILQELAIQAPATTHIVLPVASGGTLAGLLSNKVLPNVTLVGIGVLKGEAYLETLVRDLYQQVCTEPPNKAWEIRHDFHHGGYAKSSPSLKQFVRTFNAASAAMLPSAPFMIEPVYSGKCFYALMALVNEDYFPANSNIVVLHTGGLQGLRSKT